MMKPVPPRICGNQYAPSRACWEWVERAVLMVGRAVRPDIQNMEAPRSWDSEARKPSSWR